MSASMIAFNQKFFLFSLKSVFVIQLILFVFLIYAHLGLESISFIHNVLFFDLFVAEIILIYSCTRYLISLASRWRVLGYLIFSLQIIVSISQLISYQISGEFISPLALQNITHIDLILSPLIMILMLFLSFGFIYWLFVVERNLRGSHVLKFPNKRFGLLILIAFCFGASGQRVAGKPGCRPNPPRWK